MELLAFCGVIVVAYMLHTQSKRIDALAEEVACLPFAAQQKVNNTLSTNQST